MARLSHLFTGLFLFPSSLQLREVKRAVACVYERLASAVPQVDEAGNEVPVGLQPLVVLEGCFALLTSLTSQIHSSRFSGGFYSPLFSCIRLQSIDEKLVPQAEAEVLVKKEDLSLLEKRQKIEKSFSFKGKGRRSFFSSSFRPYNGKSNGKGKGKGGKGGRGRPRPSATFSSSPPSSS